MMVLLLLASWEATTLQAVISCVADATSSGLSTALRFSAVFRKKVNILNERKPPFDGHVGAREYITHRGIIYSSISYTNTAVKSNKDKPSMTDVVFAEVAFLILDRFAFISAMIFGLIFLTS